MWKFSHYKSFWILQVYVRMLVLGSHMGLASRNMWNDQYYAGYTCQVCVVCVASAAEWTNSKLLCGGMKPGVFHFTIEPTNHHLGGLQTQPHSLWAGFPHNPSHWKPKELHKLTQMQNRLEVRGGARDSEMLTDPECLQVRWEGNESLAIEASPADL